MKHQQTAPQPPGPARMVIADDHELARAGLRSMLEGDRGVVVVGEATNGAEAVELCQQLKPDLALLDVRMPDMDGLAATRVIRQVSPETRIVIVTTHENPEYLLVALKAGAAGYLLKGGADQPANCRATVAQHRDSEDSCRAYHCEARRIGSNAGRCPRGRVEVAATHDGRPVMIESPRNFRFL